MLVDLQGSRALAAVACIANLEVCERALSWHRWLKHHCEYIYRKERYEKGKEGLSIHVLIKIILWSVFY